MNRWPCCEVTRCIDDGTCARPIKGIVYRLCPKHHAMTFDDMTAFLQRFKLDQSINADFVWFPKGWSVAND